MSAEQKISEGAKINVLLRESGISLILIQPRTGFERTQVDLSPEQVLWLQAMLGKLIPIMGRSQEKDR